MERELDKLDDIYFFRFVENSETTLIMIIQNSPQNQKNSLARILIN